MNAKKLNNTEAGMLVGTIVGVVAGDILYMFTNDIVYLVLIGLGAGLGLVLGAMMDRHKKDKSGPN